MTTVAPIDLEQEAGECIALIDLENIRISWEREYASSFQYIDLALLSRLVEGVMGTCISRIIVFATDPVAYRLHLIKMFIARQSGATRPIDISDGQASLWWQKISASTEPEFTSLINEIESFNRMICALKADVQECNAQKQRRRQAELDKRREDNRQKLLQAAEAARVAGDVETLTDSEEECSVVKVVPRNIDSEDCQILDCKSKISTPRCAEAGVSSPTPLSLRDNGSRVVELRCYGYKTQKGRTIQRGCDVALGAEITKACFNPLVETICLLSADSDFRDLMQDNMKAENVGGVYKFAKSSWIVGFSKSLGHIPGIRRAPLLPHEPPSTAVFSRERIGYIPVDVAFPAIAQCLQRRRQQTGATQRDLSPKAMTRHLSNGPYGKPARLGKGVRTRAFESSRPTEVSGSQRHAPGNSDESQNETEDVNPATVLPQPVIIGTAPSRHGRYPMASNGFRNNIVSMPAR